MIKLLNKGLFIACILSIVFGYSLTVDYSEKLIGFGVLGLFFIVFPIFIYFHWKNKKLEDYMLTKESLDKMRKAEQNKSTK